MVATFTRIANRDANAAIEFLRESSPKHGTSVNIHDIFHGSTALSFECPILPAAEGYLETGMQGAASMEIERRANVLAHAGKATKTIAKANDDKAR